MMLGTTSLATLALAGCTTTTPTVLIAPPAPEVPDVPSNILAMYAAIPDERFPICFNWYLSAIPEFLGL